MFRISILLIVIICLLAPLAFAQAKEGAEFSGILKDRKVAGVVYFKKNSIQEKLTKSQQAEIDHIVSLLAIQGMSGKIVRVEGFTSGRSMSSEWVKASLSRAKSVWTYLRKSDLFNNENLYLTGFNAKQSISSLQGDRVEIAVYEDIFNDKRAVYSSN